MSFRQHSRSSQNRRDDDRKKKKKGEKMHVVPLLESYLLFFVLSNMEILLYIYTVLITYNCGFAR